MNQIFLDCGTDIFTVRERSRYWGGQKLLSLVQAMVIIIDWTLLRKLNIDYLEYLKNSFIFYKPFIYYYYFHFYRAFIFYHYYIIIFKNKLADGKYLRTVIQTCFYFLTTRVFLYKLVYLESSQFL
ncbi:hypothetical protein ACJX0J_015695 [Zea mays]